MLVQDVLVVVHCRLKGKPNIPAWGLNCLVSVLNERHDDGDGDGEEDRDKSRELICQALWCVEQASQPGESPTLGETNNDELLRLFVSAARKRAGRQSLVKQNEKVQC